MNSEWQRFLERSGARFLEGERVESFGDTKAELEAARSGNVVSPLSHLSILGFTGEDAETFLHGQLSCDVRGLGPGRSTLGSYCSPKGRMLANFLLWSDGAGFEMVLSASVAAAIQKRLSMFVLRAKVRISDDNDRVTLIGAAGAATPPALSAFFSELPVVKYDVRHLPDLGSVVRLGEDRFLLAILAQQAPGVWASLARDLKAVGTPCWEWLDIRHGIPWITAATQEQLVPQMANLELLGGVSFSKGCYPGQEVIARSHYLGQVKRRTFLVNSPEPPAEGDAIYSEEFGDQASGLIINAQESPDGGYDALAVVQTSGREQGSVRLKSPRGPEVRFLDMPYPVP